MSLTKPTNPHKNTAPYLLDDSSYNNPYDVLAALQAKEGVPDEIYDRVVSHCQDLTKESWLGFFDMYQMNIGFETDYIQFVEHETPDWVIDDDGAVTRSGNVFTIVPANIEGWTSGDDYFFFRVDDVVMVVDNAGVKEMGVITAVNKGSNQFTAVCREGANWTVDTSNISIDVTGSDHDRASCGPDGLLELRKTRTHILKLIEIKEAVKFSKGKLFKYDLENEEVAWYDENTIRCEKALNHKVAKTLMLDTESADGSGAHSAGKYGTKGLFQKLQEDGVLKTGYFQTEADIEALTDYYDELGLITKEFVIHCDTQQYRYLEKIAAEIATNLGVELGLVLNNNPDNMMAVGFRAFMKDGYTFYFSKWELKNGNSPLSKSRIKDVMPMAIIMPKGNVKTKIMGKEMEVPYIFKAYKNKELMPGMIRTFFTGGFAKPSTNDCEYLKVTKSTTVAIGVPCPESVVIVMPS